MPVVLGHKLFHELKTRRQAEKASEPRVTKTDASIGSVMRSLDTIEKNLVTSDTEQLIKLFELPKDYNKYDLPVLRKSFLFTCSY